MRDFLSSFRGTTHAGINQEVLPSLRIVGDRRTLGEARSKESPNRVFQGSID